MATNWETYNLPAIWQMLEAENVCTGADRVLAWDGLATSVRDQHRRLEKAAADLAEVWPPEKNASAKVFLRRMSDLADSMRETMTCAEDTRAGLRGVTEAIGEAQSTIRTLAEGRAEVSTDWIPRFIDHAEDEYDARAQQAMRAAEAAIADHSTQIKAPGLFSMRFGASDATPLIDDDGTGSAAGAERPAGVRATPVPVEVPHDPVLPEKSGDSAPGGASATGANSGGGQVPGVGPGLSGVANQPAVPPPGPGSLPGPPAGPGAGSGVSGGPGGVLPGAVIGGGGLGLVPGGGAVGAPPRRIGGPGAAVPGGSASGAAGHGLPSGAVLGEGGFGAGGDPVSRSPVAAQGRRHGRRQDGAEGTGGGIGDERWATLEGVAPVIAPDNRVFRHDPGPGVLGLDR